MLLVLVIVIYLILLDELVMSSAQRRFGPFNIGVFGLLASIVNGINLIIIQSFFIMSSYSVIMFLGPLVFLLILLLFFSFLVPMFIIDVFFVYFMIILLSSILVFVYFLLSYASFSKYSIIGSFRIVTQFLAFGLIFDVLLSIFLYVFSFLSFSLFSLSLYSSISFVFGPKVSTIGISNNLGLFYCSILKLLYHFNYVLGTFTPAGISDFPWQEQSSACSAFDKICDFGNTQGLFSLSVGSFPKWNRSCGTQSFSFVVSMGSLSFITSYGIWISNISYVSSMYPLVIVIPKFLWCFPSLLFVVFNMCILVESNRVPFDLPEAESELVAGFMTEFSSLYFSIIILSEYFSLIIFSLFTVLLFNLNVLLSIILLLFYCLTRATLNRLKYDELLSFGWYFLLIITFALFMLIIFI